MVVCTQCSGASVLGLCHGVVPVIPGNQETPPWASHSGWCESHPRPNPSWSCCLCFASSPFLERHLLWASMAQSAWGQLQLMVIQVGDRCVKKTLLNKQENPQFFKKIKDFFLLAQLVKCCGKWMHISKPKYLREYVLFVLKGFCPLKKHLKEIF